MKKHLFGACAAAVAVAGGTLVAGTPSSAAPTKAPIVIAYMTIETGPYASAGRNNDINLAVKQLNAAGGVDGHKVEYVGYDANITPQQAVTATQQALGTKPTAFIGYSVDDQVQATASLLRRSNIPVIAYAQGPAASSNVVHVSNLYTVVPNLVNAIQASTKYAVSKYHPTSVGIFHTDDTASNADAATAQGLLKKLGVRKFVVRNASDTATDVTEQALAMKGVSVVFEYGFPLVEAVFNTALSQNGISAPIMGDQSGNFLAAYGLNKPAQLSNYTFTPYCFAPVLQTKQAKSYVSAYSAAYPGQSVQIATPYTVDAVDLLAAAIRSAHGSLEPSAIDKALGKITFHGICGTYHTDANHDLMHQVTLVSFANGINPGTLVAKYIEASVPKTYFANAG